MIALKQMKDSADIFSNGLKINGLLHKNYKIYTSMERAMEFMLSGCIYLTNGSLWNDKSDREAMKKNNMYGTCFSYSTRENIAMWMLYGGNRGKEGAIINLYQSTISDIICNGKIEVGTIDNAKRRFEPVKELNALVEKYDIYMTDVVYEDECKGNKKRLTIYGENETVDSRVIEHEDILTKNYAWSYENECRLIVKLCDADWGRFNNMGWNLMRIKLSSSAMNKLNEGRVIRSPIYDGKSNYGTNSSLMGNVEWEL